MVGICQVSQAGNPLTICEDEAEAFRISQAVAAQLGLRLYDGADALAVQLGAGQYLERGLISKRMGLTRMTGTAITTGRRVIASTFSSTKTRRMDRQ